MCYLKRLWWAAFYLLDGEPDDESSGTAEQWISWLGVWIGICWFNGRKFVVRDD